MSTLLQKSAMEHVALVQTSRLKNSLLISKQNICCGYSKEPSQ